MSTKQHFGVQSLILLTIVLDVLDVLGHCWKHLIMFENAYKSFDGWSLFKDTRSLFKTHGQSGFCQRKSYLASFLPVSYLVLDVYL